MSSLPQIKGVEQSSMLVAALEYCQHGLGVIPLIRAGKKPLVAWKHFQAARPTSDQVLEWFAEYPNANIGILTGAVSGIVVLDIDSEAGLELARSKGLPDQTPAVKTGKGWHLYFKYPGDKIANFVRKMTDIDLRGEGGYVVAPPSIHENGKAYTWFANTVNLPFADLPSWVIELTKPERREPAFQQEAVSITRPRAYSEAALNSAAGRVASAQQGTRNDTLFRETSDLGKLLGGGFPIDRAVIEQTMLNAALSAGLSQDEADKTIGSALVHGISQPRTIDDITPPTPHKNGKKPGAPAPRSNGVSGNGDGSVPTGDSDTEPIEANIGETDLGNARRLVRNYGQDIRFVYRHNQWRLWDGQRWSEDDTLEIQRLARRTVASIYKEASTLPTEKQRVKRASWAIASESRNHLESMVKTAEAEEAVGVSPQALDADPWLFNCQNGTLDLRTGDLRPHNRLDLIARIANTTYDPDATCPTWMGFLDRIMDGNTNVINFLRKSVGYSLTAEISEQCLFFMYGTGKNGKSTFIETLASMLGDYQLKTPTETLMSKAASATGVRNDVARLASSRMVIAAETEEGRRLDESLIKDMTGGDTITARFLHKEFFSFKPTHKIWIYGNHKPAVKGTDEGFWRRMRLIPFKVTISKEERDPNLGRKLIAELPGILTWAVQGCLEWQNEGLPVPDDVMKATEDYRAEMDVVAAWLGDCCIIKPDARAFAKDLYTSYTRWCEESGEISVNQRRWGASLTERGFLRQRTNVAWQWKGIGLLEKVIHFENE
jgi:putative DNA primase/helicase